MTSDRVAIMTSPSLNAATLLPSTERFASRSPTTEILISVSGLNTRERSNNICGATGVNWSDQCVGATMEPRAERLYAVEPVGVETIRPSPAYVAKGESSIVTSSRTV